MALRSFSLASQSFHLPGLFCRYSNHIRILRILCWANLRILGCCIRTCGKCNYGSPVPISSSKLTAQWQGPYSVVKRIGKANYLLKMYNRRKKTAVFHVNMLQQWHTPTSTGFLTMEVSDEEVDIPCWNDGEGGRAQVGSQLSPSHMQELHCLLKKYEATFQTLPGHTTLTEHHIVTEQSSPVHLPHSTGPRGS